MNIFLTSDPHYWHRNITTFINDDGTKMRPWDDVEEMNEALVANHNSVVKPTDKVYFLGDIAFKSKYLEILHRLNGKKVLIKGNHDNLKLKDYLPYFYDIRSCHPMDNFLLTHIPIHPSSLSRWKGNIHGHLHSYRVKKEDGSIDERYLCVSVEQTDFKPISFEDAKKRFNLT